MRGARLWRSVGRGLASGPSGGALLLAALFVVDLFGSDIPFMGLSDRQATATVLARARTHAIGHHALILATLVVVGAIFGAVGSLAGRAWDFARGRPPSRWAVVRGMAAALIGHACFLARSVVEYPQLYSTHLYERGGARGAIMVFLTDHVSPRAIDATLAAIVGLAFVPPLVSKRGRAGVRAAAVWIARAARRSAAAARRRPRVAVGIGVAAAGIAITVALAGGGAGRGAGGGADGAARRMNVVVIAVDSLRPERVYGDRAARDFPALAQLAARGVNFWQAFVTQARTFPSMVTLLTGRWPHHHGIRHEFPSPAARAGIGPTLPAALSAAGWRTAVVSDYSGEIFGRAPLGFDEVDVPRFDLDAVIERQVLSSHLTALPYAATRLGQRLFPAIRSMAEFDDPALLADRAIDRLDGLAGRPFFLLVFFSSPHAPYPAPWPFYRRFTDASYRGRFRYLKEPLPMQAVLPAADTTQVRALYDGAVAAVDAAIARILAELERRGLDDDTIIVLLGDHGENLFDVPGRGMGHGDHLWGDRANHIPLTIVDPSRPAPRPVVPIVRDVDLAPTLARRLGVQLPPGDGVDLAPLLDGEPVRLELDAYAETGLWLIAAGPGFRREDRLPYPAVWDITEAAPDGDIYLQPSWEQAVIDAKVRAIRTDLWKLVEQPAPDGVHWRLFDLTADPEQRNDVAAEHPGEVAALRARLEAWTAPDQR